MPWTDEQKKLYMKEWRAAHRDEIKLSKQKWYKTCGEEYKQRRSEYSKKYRLEHLEELREKKKAYSKIYRQTHKEQLKEKSSEYNKTYGKKYRDTHKDEKRELGKLYYVLNKEKINERNRAYNATHKDELKIPKKKYLEAHRSENGERGKMYLKTQKGKSMQARKRHRRRGAVNATVCDLTFEQWDTIISEQNNCCAHCGNEFTIELPSTRDHIIPVSKGGGLTYENVQALCRPCNSRKRDRFEHELEYLQKLEATITFNNQQKQ